MSKDNGKIIKRLYIKADIKLETPIMLGSGEVDNTDMDIIKDYTGIPFIPASSIAGVFRSYLDELLEGKPEKDNIGILFGKDDDNDFTISCLTIYDGIFRDNWRLGIRDGIKLSDKKAAETNSKYDYEIIETGGVFTLKMELIIRKCHEEHEKSFKDLIAKILNGIKKREIFIGAKTSRGFGYLSLTDGDLSIMELNFENGQDATQKWINFKWDEFKSNKSLKDLGNIGSLDTIYNKLVAELSLPCSIMIRTYSNNPDDVDYEHIRCGGKPVIPGTSYAGAFRQSSAAVLKELCGNQNNERIKELIDNVYGFVNKEDKTSKASLIRFKESEIIDGSEKTKSLLLQRVKIDRFAGGAIDKGLYNEKPQYFGRTNLEILIKKGNDHIMGLVLLVLKELNIGIVAIGGETSIGRGILKVENINIDGIRVNDKKEERYFIALVERLRREGLLDE